MSLAVTDLALPTTLDGVTADWVGRALSFRFPGVRVAEVSRSVERAGTSTSARLELTYDDRAGHTDLPQAVYVKGGFDEVMRRRVWQALIQEARFYADFAPDCPVNIPHCYFAGVDETNRQGVLLLEDLSERGVNFGHATQDVTADQMADILEQQARYHAHWWGAPSLASHRTWAEPQRLYLKYMFRPSNWEEIHRRSYGDLVPQVLPNREAALAGLDRLWAINDALPATLVHGDCHGGNLFFEADGRVGFLDWQCVFPGTVGHDVMWAMVCALDTDTRQREEVRLIKHYLGALRSHGADAPDFEALFLSYRQNIMHGMASAVGNPFDMQTEEVTNITARRTLNAAIDLDLAGALGIH